MHIPKTWDERLTRAVKMMKASGTGGPPDENAPPRDKAPPFKVPASVKIRQVKFPRQKYDGLEDVGLDQSAEVSAEWVEPAAAHGGFALPTIVYFHGGGFWSSSPEEHRFVTVPFVNSSNAGIKLLVVDYRLAPKNPYPSQIIDAVSVYQHLLMVEGMDPEMIFFAGDSAGGNLAVSAAMYLRDNPSLDLPPPKGLVLLSPWLDIHRSSPTMSLEDEFTACLLDAMKVGDTSTEPAPLPYTKYAKVKVGHTDAMVSPLYDQGNLPATMIAVGTVDRFFGECLAEGIKQVAKGDTVVMDYYEDQIHVFQGYHWVPLTPVFFKRAVEFVKSLAEGNGATTSSTFISYSGKEQECASGADDTVKEMQKRLQGFIDRATKAGKYGQGWKKTGFYKDLAKRAEAKL